MASTDTIVQVTAQPVASYPSPSGVTQDSDAGKVEVNMRKWARELSAAIGNLKVSIPQTTSSDETTVTTPGATTTIPGLPGANGWTPVIALVSGAAGVGKVMEVIDWTGGSGTKPATAVYVSTSGFTTDIAAATDIQGPPGPPSPTGMFNVLDYGVIAGGTVDQTVVINALAAFMPAKSTMFFPCAGAPYNVFGTITTNKEITIRGDGPNGAVLQTNSATLPILALNPGADFSVLDIQFQTMVSRTAGNPVVKFDGAGAVTASRILINCTGDGLALGTQATINFLTMTNVTVFSRSPAGCSLIIGSCGGCISSSFFWTLNNKPCGHIFGPLTSLQISNCGFAGGGALYQYASATGLNGITSSGTAITVSLSNTAGFAIGGYIVLKGMTSTAYNGFWRITGVSANTSVTCVATPFFTIPGSGTGTVGTGIAETVPACLQIDNSGIGGVGFVNESMISNCGFYSSVYPTDPVSAGILIDGTQTGYAIEGILFSNNYIDYGKVGYWFWGGPSVVNVERIAITGGTVVGNGPNPTENGLGYVWLARCPSVTVSNLVGNANPLSTSPASSGIYIYSDSSVLSDGFRASGCDLCLAGFNTSTQNPSYGITIDGGISSALTTINLTGCTIWGQTAPIRVLNGGIGASTNIGCSGNDLYSGSGATPTVAYVPYFSPINSKIVGLFRLTTSQGPLTSGTETPVVWTTPDFDPAGMWASGTPTVLTLPAGTKRVRIQVYHEWDANVSNNRIIKIKDQSANTWGRSTITACTLAGQPTGGPPADTFDLDVAATGITSFNITATQDSGGGLNLRGTATGGTKLRYEIIA